MSQCPVCHAPIKDDFGLMECAQCGAQLIVHMDGHVEYQGAQEAVDFGEPPAEEKEGLGEFGPIEPMRELDLDEIPEIDAAAAVEEVADLVPPGGTDEAYRMPEDDLYEAKDDHTQEIKESPPAGPSAEDEEESKEFLGAPNEEDDVSEFPEPTETPGPLAPSPSDELFPDFESPGPAPENVYNAGGDLASPDLGDVAQFGNSDLSGGREGPLRYNLILEGIDTVDVREVFREAITDRKLMWDADQILKTVRNGCVKIPNVAPTKAYILITRLRGTPVQIRWEQYAISQT